VSAQPTGGANAPASPEPAALDLAVDRAAEIPIGVQLAWALRTRIRDGQFKPRERLPGLREVAEATGVNVNTVRAVYQRLEQEGLIDSQQGSGTFVAATPHRPSAVASIAADAAREAHETGVDPRDVAAALYVSPERGGQAKDDAAGRRRLLREQIAVLERTLGELEAKHPGVAPATASSPHRPGTGKGERVHGGIGPTLLSAGELERVRTQLVRRLSVVQAAIDELGSDQHGERSPRRTGRQKRGAQSEGAARATRGARESRAGEGEREAPPPSKPAGRARPRTRPAPAGA
jgi:DNA-binding transcriptional regulator YhcF (GntR family)